MDKIKQINDYVFQSEKPVNVLVIPDSHSNPSTSNRRYDWLGNFIVDTRPDVIVDIGDWADMATLGNYNKGTKKAWGALYKDEVEACRDANRRAFSPIKELNKRAKKSVYNPLILRCGGNHEEGRYAKFINSNPEFSEHIGVKDLGFTDYGAKYVPFLQPVKVNNVSFAHYFYPKTQNYPCGKARQMLLLNHSSCVQGHTHSYDYSLDYSIDKRKIQAVISGCYLDPFDNALTFSYAGPQTRWWNGLVMLHAVNNKGEFDVEQISMDRIMNKYGA